MDAAGKDVPVSQNVLEYEDDRDELILAPVSHFIQTVPTNIWEEFAKAFNYWLNVPDKIFKEVANNFRYYYYVDRLFEAIRVDATSPISDKLSCISIYGEPCTLNALFQTHLIAAKNLTLLNLSMTPTLYLEQIEESCIARFMEYEWIETVVCPTEEEYYHMIVKQTSGYFGAQLKFLHLYSSNQNNFRRLTEIFGLFLRILEDYRYFISTEGSVCKFYLPDEILGSFSLPIIHAVKSKTMEGGTLMELLRRRTNNKELKIYAVSVLEKIGSLEYTRITLMKLKEEALLEMGKFEKNPLLESIFDKYFNIPLPPDTVAAETSMDSISDTIETLKISTYLNQLENVQSDERVKKKLLEPFDYLNAVRKRKYVLPIFKLFNETIKTPEDKMVEVTKFMCTFGYAVLMLDDIQDKSILRKRVPCSYLIYGMVKTINCILYTFSKGFENVIMLDNPKVVNLYYEYILEMFRGQGMELYWRDNYICPTEKEYVRMICGKTGGPIGVLFNMMKMCSKSTVNLEKIPKTMSMYFQIYDDYENLIGQEYYEAKGFCEDITEGKFGFPTIHAINTHPNVGKQLIDILRQRTYDVEVKKLYLSLLEKCGSFEYTRKKLMEIRSQLNDELEPFSKKDEIKAIIRNKFHITLAEEQIDKKTFL